MTTSLLIFDSGVGGLSIFQEVRAKLPNLSIHYLMDNAAFPYGNKADDFLIERILAVCTQAVAELQPSMLVIACNTASTLALKELRQALDIPVVGVVPAIKTAATLTTTGSIGLLATAATVNRSYTDQLIHDFAHDCTVSKFGSANLVEWAENWLLHKQPVCLEDLQLHLQQWLTQDPNLQYVVLGCTHFPLLRPYLEQLWPQIHWIDSGEAIARRVQQLLGSYMPSAQCLTNLYWTDEHSCPVGVADYLQQSFTLNQQQALPIRTATFV